MCNPILFALASTGLSAAQSLSQARAARKAAAAQARAAEENARIAREEAASKARRQRRVGQRQRAGFRARLGASGVVGAGSPVDALASSAADTELDALSLMRQGELRARQSLLARNDAIRAGQKARQDAVFGVGNSLLQAGSILTRR